MEITKKFDRYTTLRILAERGALQHSVATPVDLVDEMVALGGKSLTEDAKILVMFNVEFAVSLSEDFPWTKDNITLFTNGDPTLEKLAQKMEINTIDSLETDMKFNLGLANPPFTEGQKLLYAQFFEKGLEMCDEVVFVMPVALESQHKKLQKHNYRIKRHSSYVSESVSDKYFKGVGVPNICVVAASKNIKNEVAEEVDVLDSMKLLHPRRPRLSVNKGCGRLVSVPEVESDNVCVFKVLRDGPVYKTLSDEDYQRSKKVSNCKWFTFVGHTPSRGAVNAVVEKNTGQTWSQWVFAFECDSKKEATMIKEWLESEKIRKEIWAMLSAKSTHAVSKVMLERLPTYE